MPSVFRQGDKEEKDGGGGVSGGFVSGLSLSNWLSNIVNLNDVR